MRDPTMTVAVRRLAPANSAPTSLSVVMREAWSGGLVNGLPLP